VYVSFETYVMYVCMSLLKHMCLSCDISHDFDVYHIDAIHVIYISFAPKRYMSTYEGSYMSRYKGSFPPYILHTTCKRTAVYGSLFQSIWVIFSKKYGSLFQNIWVFYLYLSLLSHISVFLPTNMDLVFHLNGSLFP